MEKKRIRRVAALHDLSGFGRCALTVVIPTLSVMGVQVVPLPTALLSTHTGGFDNYYFQDLSDSMEKIAAHWEALGLRFDAIYTGFLASAAQCELVKRFNRRFGSGDTMVLVDPVFGDDGALYSACTPELVRGMHVLCAQADSIVPNLTEACMLCGRSFEDTAAMSQRALTEYVTKLLYELAEIGPKKIVITGIAAGGDNVVTAGLDLSGSSLDHTPFFVSLKRIGGAYPGTGELFASVMLGKLLSGASFPSAVTAASAFVRDVIDFSTGFDTPRREGVALEPCLHRLSEL